MEIQNERKTGFFYVDRVACRNSDDYYPAGAEFLTFASFFFLIIKHL